MKTKEVTIILHEYENGQKGISLKDFDAGDLMHVLKGLLLFLRQSVHEDILAGWLTEIFEQDILGTTQEIAQEKRPSN